MTCFPLVHHYIVLCIVYNGNTLVSSTPIVIPIVIHL